ncbi:MAG: DUF599 domain-containing protein [Rhodobacteraceae bacterium]|nr:DUF599 domain-containing protein [Paracoccaceae bacterium]
MTQKILDILAPFTTLDRIGVLLLLAGWALIGFLVERDGKRRSTHSIIADYRARWMVEMVARDNRIIDSQILTSLRQGAAFFTSASMIGIGGTLALLGSAETLQEFATDVSADLSAPRIVWEVKLMFVMLILSSAFLKFVWSHRLFGYCAVVLASVPNDPDHPEALKIAHKAGMINTYAARSFNRGLRAVYFALAALTWLVGPVPFILAVCATWAVLYRREFHSQSRAALLAD